MEILFTFLIKMTIIFFGGGVASLMALWAFRESNQLIKSILIQKNKRLESGKLNIIGEEKISLASGVFQVFLPNNQIIKLFSSHQGIKRL